MDIKNKKNKRKQSNKDKKRVKRELDQLWRDVVILKAGGQCEVCGTEKNVQAHHMYSRTFITTRFDHKNGVALCPLHHTLGRFSAHKNGIWFTKWLKENRKEDLEEMTLKYVEPKKQKDILFDLIKMQLSDQKDYLLSLMEE